MKSDHVGGERGFDLIKKRQGMAKAVTIMVWTRRYVSKCFFPASIFMASLSSIKPEGRVKLIRHPIGRAMLPNAVAIALYKQFY
jgi:hypothetical protein